MIESLIQDRGLKAVKVAGTHGGEWACPCPACGGKDRFRFWPAQGEGGTWYCRQCDKGGDSIQFLREFEGLSYTEACRRLGVERAAAPTSIMPRADKEERRGSLPPRLPIPARSGRSTPPSCWTMPMPSCWLTKIA